MSQSAPRQHVRSYFRTRNPLSAKSLAVMTHIERSRGRASFMSIMGACGFRLRGCVSFQGRKLAEAGFITLEKSGAGQSRHTVFVLTAAGRKALAAANTKPAIKEIRSGSSGDSGAVGAHGPVAITT